MRSALTITELYDLTEHSYQRSGIMLLFFNLIGNHLYQSPLLCIQFDRICNTPIDNPCIKRTVDIVRSPQFIGFTDNILRGITGNHDNRYIFNNMTGIHGM